ncbi:MAG: endonuclease III [Oligoflexia bacterium]|nr:endonuclease III [Oligoflexia bacterium]
MESFEKRKRRLKSILLLLNKNYPSACCALNFKNPLELLVATQLSAQCTDKRVNLVTKSLFEKYKTAKDYAKAPIQELEKAVRSTGFFRNKARNLKQACASLEKNYKGRVPKNFAKLTQLSGVGRKTAHVVMGNAFQISSGVVVDTHVKRLSNRMGLVNTENVHQIERKLEQIVPKNKWIMFSHWLIEHGRKICTARKPLCSLCFLYKHCPREKVSSKRK